MTKDYWAIAALFIASIGLVVLLGKRNQIREGFFAFVAAQTLTWPSTLDLARRGSIESPVRLFSKATDGNLVISFVFLPAVFVVYYLHYPRNKSRLIQMAYTLAVSGAASLVHVALEHYTNLVIYITFSGYKAWLVLTIGYYILRHYADWYLAQLAKLQAGGEK